MGWGGCPPRLFTPQKFEKKKRGKKGGGGGRNGKRENEDQKWRPFAISKIFVNLGGGRKFAQK